jgi:outer membrane protein assembly factor BamE
MSRKFPIVLALLGGLVLSGCGLIHKIDIQQGNVVEQETLAKLELGMPKEKVRFVLGSPMLTDVFHKDRWDYFYSLRKGGEATEKRHVVLFFENDRLAKIAGDVDMALPEKAPVPPAGTEELPLL